MPARRAGFTLIEVLVVVAIIALLVAILLPSLANARAQSQRTACASNLKQIANGMAMYQIDNKDSLPGPIHAALELETYQKDASEDYEQWHLPYLLRKYFTDKSVGGKSTDDVVTCPTALRISTNKLKNIYGRSEWKRPFSYALNGWNSNYGGAFGTDPPWYFGWPDHFWQNAPAPFREQPGHSDECEPKKIGVVKQPSREWAFGDGFIYETALRATYRDTPGQWQYGTYQFTFATEFLPGEPFHTKGINLAMFDSHVEWQRPWRGSVNRP